MTKESKKNLGEIFKGSSFHLVCTDLGLSIEGNRAAVLACLSMIISHLHSEQGISKELIENAVRAGLMDPKDLDKEVLEKLKGLLEKIVEGIK